MNNEAIKKIADHYGQFNQRVKLFEELGELQTAMAKYMLCPVKNNEDAEKLMKIAENLVEEIADVTIMLEQMKYLLQISDTDIEQIIEQKLNRQLERIDKEN